MQQTKKIQMEMDWSTHDITRGTKMDPKMEKEERPTKNNMEANR